MENGQQEYNFKEEKIKSPIDGSENCFRVFTEPASDEHYLCMNSGYMASSNFTFDDEDFQTQMDGSPELVKALQFFDEEREIVWIPCVLNMGPLGMVFPDGNLENWVWKHAKNVEIPEEEQKNYPVFGKEDEYYTSRLDVDNAETFDRNNFIGACKSMGVIKDGKIDKSMFYKQI